MNTLDILEKIGNDEILKKVFAGVFPINLIPPLKHLPCAFIINLDSSHLPGSHWIGMFFTIKGKCEYFDSYGRLPNKTILEYISAVSDSYVYNNICVQDLWSTSCGNLCLYFLIWRCRGISFKQIIETMQSDAFITGFVDSL